MIINLQENDEAYLIARMNPKISFVIDREQALSNPTRHPVYFLMRFDTLENWNKLVHTVEFNNENYMFVMFFRNGLRGTSQFLYNEFMWNLKNTYTQLREFDEVPTLYFTGRGSEKYFTLAHNPEAAMTNVLK